MLDETAAESQFVFTVNLVLTDGSVHQIQQMADVPYCYISLAPDNGVPACGWAIQNGGTAVYQSGTTLAMQYNTPVMTLYQVSDCTICGAEGVAHQLRPCGSHCTAQLPEYAHQPAVCGFTGGEYYNDQHQLVHYDGHYDCDGLTHSSEIMSKYCDFEQGHQHTACWPTNWHYCDPASGGCGDFHTCWSSYSHSVCSACGEGKLCQRDDAGKLIHYAPCDQPAHRPCTLDSFHWADHDECYFCKKPCCVGNHDDCYFKTQSVLCPYCESEGEHAAAACTDHCVEQAGDHSWCDLCESWKCVDGSISHGTGAGQCSEPECIYCGTKGVVHAVEPCGYHCVEQEGEHIQCNACDNYYCKSGWMHNNPCDHCYAAADAAKHAWCEFCDEGHLCYGGHSELGCFLPYE